ncbi:glutamate-binding protein [Sphaerisporangium krabiense]|uniref:Glutamate transport system substrate-binding protein n=1 Tax=Sphaerisporangium krabiense TaxID=763782 RepID=A0A7W8Z731_9ACTN|nr:transporter substrate-binding domain-containing protein [Sphaerisporangium krabiense]MBB5628683.1 glutamate transport system substrate-binding protein [Sphaerisporangium krabiense]GII60477.1 glutamate-binding protein [Sphaerisporangium krabiense]
MTLPARPSPARRGPRAGVAALVMALPTAAAVLTACGGGHGALVVGVREGRPGLAERSPSGGYEGFEIEVAGYVARRLGYRDDQVSYVPAPASPPADLTMGVPVPRDGADPVAGPYLVSGQDILAPAGDLSVRGLRDLTRKRVCTAAPGPLVDRFGAAWRRAFLITSTVEDCARMLVSRQVGAVTGDAAVLAGLAAASPGAFRTLSRPFTREGQGIAVTGDDLRRRVEDALRAMFDDGSWRRAVIRHLGPLAGKYPSPPALRPHAGPRAAP